MADMTGAPPDVAPKASSLAPAGGLGSYLLRATMANWLSSLLAVLYALFITPIVIDALQKDLYGVWSFLNGVLAYSSLFYLGLGSAFIKYLSQFRAAGDRHAVNRLASVVFVIYTTIGVICLVLCLALARQVPSLFAEPLDASATQQSVAALMLLGSRLLFMFVATVFSGVLYAEERIGAAARVNIAGTIGRFIAVPLLLGHGPPLVTLAMIMSVSAAFEACALTVSALRFVPSLRIVPALPSIAELRMLYGFGFKSFFILFSAWLVNYTDTTVIGLRLGAASVAVYSIPLQLVAYGRVAVQGMVAALLPRLAAYEATGDRATLTAAYLRVSRATSYVAAFIALNLLTLGVSFIRLWVGDEFAEPSRVVLYILALAAYCYAVSTQSSVSFYQAMGALRAPVLILVVEALVNLGLSIWLSTRLGITGVAVATLVPAMFITLLLLPANLCRQLGVQPSRLFTSGILPSITLLAAGLTANIVFDAMIPASSFVLLAVRGLLNAGVAVALALALLPGDDLNAMRRVLRPWKRDAGKSPASQTGG